MVRRERRAPTALQSVLNSIARTAAKLCDARDARISLLDGDEFRLVAYTGKAPLVMRESHPVDRRMPQGDAALRARVLHIRDMQRAVRHRYTAFAPVARASGMRTVLVSPLMRGRTVLGVILIRRDRVQPFTPKQIALLKTFADQAAIAVENARLSDELAARNRALRDALDQQTATAEILRVISTSPGDIRPVLDTVARNAASLCNATDVTIFLVEGDRLRRETHHGPLPDIDALGAAGLDIIPENVNGYAVIQRSTVQVADLQAEAARFPGGSAWARQLGFRTMVSVPLLTKGAAIGVIAVRRAEVRPFTDSQIALVETFADQAVIALENVRLFKELQERNRALTEALEQQTATSEILQIISRAPTQPMPVLFAIAERAARLCDAWNGTILLSDGAALRMEAHYGPLPEQVGMSLPIDRDSVSGRAFCDGRPVHIEDLSQDVDFQLGREIALRFGVRTALAVPLIRQDAPVGVILIRRAEVRRFSDKQIELLRTFADQAVIAIENARLFTKLQERNRDLTTSL